ncbi:MAG: hypothetical protein ABR555_03690 [Pyrinomonadaceae bacterium]
MKLVQTVDAQIAFLLHDLPDEPGARLFLQNLEKRQAVAYRRLVKQPALLSDVLALASWSQLLATTLEQNPDYLSWLGRERADPRVRTCEELRESLARFALTNSELDPQVVFARFRRRELLRTYLHDIRRTHTLVETTEELSNLADAILDYALSLARQDLDNRYGAPTVSDERSRIAPAEFTIVALGKLGSLELNYASDIDLTFIYSAEGKTSGTGDRGEITNREYFVKLAERVTQLVGKPGGEGAAYRVDLRLRPYGRDGTLACSLEEAIRYYKRTAQDWERQTLIRARAAAGSSTLFSRFKEDVVSSVFRIDTSVAEALRNVRLARQKIEDQAERKFGLNVKLGRGGIREIEFIAQALQLAHGGKDPWLRVSHTLMSLGRLTERGFINESEHTQLSDAYDFLRTLEHRLQMEHGLQTHIVPETPGARLLVGRRMGFPTAAEFAQAVSLHTTNVRSVFDRLFLTPQKAVDDHNVDVKLLHAESWDLDRPSALAAAKVFSNHLQQPFLDEDQLASALQTMAVDSQNPHRSLLTCARIAASLEKSPVTLELTTENLLSLTRLCGASEFFGDMLAANPSLISSLHVNASWQSRRDYRAVLRAAIDVENSFTTEIDVLRRKWAELLTEIGLLDVSSEAPLRELNRLQTDLAVASLNVAYLIVRRELARRFGRLSAGPRIAFFGAGRLGSGGVDYGSDLDILITYDSLVPSPIAELTQDQAYGRLVELMITALSSITRAGYLYRIDLRLRPHGKNGPLVVSSDAFLDYLKVESAPWEWLAYVKLRAIGGDMELGKMVETHARHRIHQNALKLSDDELRCETRRVRDRLEIEKTKRSRHGGVDIKYARGGMLDVYFVVRYLQLRDEIPDEGDDRSTAGTLERLNEEGSLDDEDFGVLSDGYSFLRLVDHNLRLISGRSTHLPAADHAITRDIASKLGFNAPETLVEKLTGEMKTIRETYGRILNSQPL